MDNREKRILENLGLVHACARRFIGRGIDYEDLYQIGCIGLIKASDGFDPSRGLCFSTYAVPTILGEIRRVFRDSGSVKVSRSLKELAFRVRAEWEKAEQQSGNQPCVSEIALRLGVTSEQVAEALCVLQPTVSLTREREEDDSQTDLPVDSCEEECDRRMDLQSLLEQLSEKEQRLIALRYFTCKTQSETAAALGMTQVQVSRAEKRILDRLRQNERAS